MNKHLGVVGFRLCILCLGYVLLTTDGSFLSLGCILVCIASAAYAGHLSVKAR